MTSYIEVTEKALAKTDTKEGDRSLSRSPHPYHRRSASLARDDPSIPNFSIPQDDTSESSTERGTEADDEKGLILRGLPAPQLRARKGWKGSKSPLDLTPALSPWPSPPPSEHGQTYFGGQKERKLSKTSKASGQPRFDAETYKKYAARRKAEIVRRCTETILIALMGLVSCRKAWHSGKLQPWKNEMAAAAAIAFLTYASYPLQLVTRRYLSGSSPATALRQGFRIPSRFDPGPLLYPVFFPFFIAVSLMDLDEHCITVNIILGIASVPRGVWSEIPVQVSTILQWMLCLAPLAASQTRAHRPVHASQSHPDSWDRIGLCKETLALLFPLHQSLLTLITYLTTTSLDPAEIQLLSTGLINLLLFAISPQVRIMRAVLWLGGILLFILCHTSLCWEVSLARIPTWKFARNKSPKAGFLGRLEAVLDLLQPSHQRRKRRQLDSDDEDYDHLRQARRRARVNGKLTATRTWGVASDMEFSRHETLEVLVEPDTNGIIKAATFPLKHGIRKVPRSGGISSRSGFLAMTLNQAFALKWIIAGYVYTVVLAIVMLILRPYIGHTALSSHEPFGWAIGYLLGNISPFRLWVVSNNLERWIALPPHRLRAQHAHLSGWVEYYRHVVQGPANTRLLLVGYCLAVLAAGLFAVSRLQRVVEVDTRRKIFHGIMVAMLLPIIPVDPCFVSLALIIILAVFLLLDLFRASQLPPLSRPLTAFLAPYVDGRDYRGPVIISHIFLLIGCAIPLWLAQAGVSRAGDDPWTAWELSTRDLSMVSGVVCVGMGDAAASLIGRRYGRTKWFWGGGKSIEGSCAFVLAVTIGLMASYLWLRVGGWMAWDASALLPATTRAVMAASGASLLESVLTAANDNVVVPVGLWLLVRGLDL